MYLSVMWHATYNMVIDSQSSIDFQIENLKSRFQNIKYS